MKNFSVLVFSFFLILISCDTKKAQDEGTNYSSANFDNPFKLDSSKGVQMNNDDLKIELVKIIEDSRCPEGTTCVWAGQVRVSLKIISNGNAQEVELIKKGKSPESAMKKVAGYQILLMEVNPYPKEGAELKLEDYKLTMAVQKN